MCSRGRPPAPSRASARLRQPGRTPAARGSRRPAVVQVAPGLARRWTGAVRCASPPPRARRARERGRRDPCRLATTVVAAQAPVPARRRPRRPASSRPAEPARHPDACTCGRRPPDADASNPAPTPAPAPAPAPTPAPTPRPHPRRRQPRRRRAPHPRRAARHRPLTPPASDASADADVTATDATARRGARGQRATPTHRSGDDRAATDRTSTARRHDRPRAAPRQQPAARAAATRRGHDATTGSSRDGHNARRCRARSSRAGSARSAPRSPLWDIWRRLPPKQRRWLVEQARTHGPRHRQAGDRRPAQPPQALARRVSAARAMRSCSIRCAVG